MKDSKKIRSEIKQVKSELSTLEKQRKTTIEKLSRVKQDIAKIGTKEARELQADKSLLDDVIREKQSQLETLQQQLETRIEAEKRQEKIDNLIQLSRQANQLKEKHLNSFTALNKHLQKAIPEIIALQINWRNTALEFQRIAKSVDTPLDTLILELEETGANLNAALSRMVVDVGNQARGKRKIEGVEFGSGIYEMMKSFEIEHSKKKAS